MPFFFLPLFCSLDAFCKKKCIFTSEHQTTGRITFQLFRSGLQIFSFSFSNVGCATKQDKPITPAERNGRRVSHSQPEPRRRLTSSLFVFSLQQATVRTNGDRLRQSAVAPSGKLVPDNTRLRLHVKISRLSCQNCIFFIFYLALTIFL